MAATTKAPNHVSLTLSPSTELQLEPPYEELSNGWTYLRHPEGLKIIIVGSGIGGLAAAVALRQHGHNIEIYEASRLSKEVGAALHTPPNGNAVLKGLGISCKDIGANLAEWMSEWTYTGEKVKKVDLLAHSHLFEHNWRLAHRVRLHDALKKAALSEDGPGRPATLHLSRAVKDVDTTNAIVYFNDGSYVQGDVVIGADGVHSVTRTKLQGGDIQPFPSGASAFRFLVPRETILADPRTAKFAEDSGNLCGIFGPDRSVIIYPTANNTMLNFVCIHPDTESDTTEGWGSNTGRDNLLSVYKSFHPDVLAVLEKADPHSLKAWKLLDMAPLPKWHDGRMAVIGDAAHPFMPFLGQGASIAIEDAVAIGVLLERGISREEVPDRLELYQEIRKERAELIQHYTRLSGKARTEKNAAFNAAQYQGYCFGHDEWHNSAQKLREWKWARYTRRSSQMTTVFGPSQSLRQIYRSPLTPNVDPTFTIASIRFNTSRTVLDGFLPPGNKSFRFKSPGTVAQCTFRQTSFRGVPSLGGRGYNHLGLYIHGIEHKDEEGKTVDGAFLPIMFENLADTITAGREELGAPKVWSTIDIERDRTSYHIRTGWEGLTWGNFYLDGLKLSMPSEVEDAKDAQSGTAHVEEDIIMHQYVPCLNAKSTLDQLQHERTIVVPRRTKSGPVSVGVNEHGHENLNENKSDSGSESRSIPHRVWRAQSAKFNLNARDWLAFPTLHHILSRLQQMPLLSVIDARIVEGAGIPELV